MHNKKIISFLSLFFVLVFIVWLNGGCSAGSGYDSFTPMCGGDTIAGQVLRPYAELRSDLEKRTGQSLEGWTYAKLIELETELKRLKQERIDAEKDHENKLVEKSKEVSAYYVDDEEDLAYAEPETVQEKKPKQTGSESGLKALGGQWKGDLSGNDSFKVYVNQDGQQSEGFISVEGGSLEF